MGMGGETSEGGDMLEGNNEVWKVHHPVEGMKEQDCLGGKTKLGGKRRGL